MDFKVMFQKFFVDVLKTKYAKFDGRAGREEFWMFVLINFVICIALAIVGRIIPLTGFLGMIYNLALLVPSIAIGIRRLHDTNRTGWWSLLWFVLFIGWIVLIVFAIQPSDVGDNQYGPNPNTPAA